MLIYSKPTEKVGNEKERIGREYVQRGKKPNVLLLYGCKCVSEMETCLYVLFPFRIDGGCEKPLTESVGDRAFAESGESRKPREIHRSTEQAGTKRYLLFF